jgi:hypothetical protein
LSVEAISPRRHDGAIRAFMDENAEFRASGLALALVKD